MVIDRQTLQILTAMGRDPLGSVKNLGKSVGLSENTLKKKLNDLYSNNVILGVSAQVNPTSVGLEPIAVFAEVEPDDFEVVEKVCELHPYTRYRIRFFGSNSGVFTMFSIPQHTTYMLIDLFEKLQQQDFVKGYRIEVPTSSLLTVETNFDSYDAEKGWSFDWDIWEGALNEEEPLTISPHPNVLRRLDNVDMKIIRQLTIDARRKNNDLAAAAGVEPYHMSRRRKILEELGVIQGYRVVVGEQLLQLTSHAIVKCKCTIERTRLFASALEKLPFQSTLIPTLEGFILYTTTTSLDFPSLVTTLRRYCTSIESMWCDYRSSLRYWFYDKPFEDGEWKADADFMVTSVLNGMNGVVNP